MINLKFHIKLYTIIIMDNQQPHSIKLSINCLLKIFQQIEKKMNTLNIFSSGEDKDKLREIYKSSIRASYFNHMAVNDFTKKSRIQLQQRATDQNVDQNTFRLMRVFKAPENGYCVIKKNGTVSTQSNGGFFACFGRKQYQAMLKNSVLQIYLGNKLKLYFDFDVINATVNDKKDRFEIILQTCNKAFSLYPMHGGTSSEWTNTIKQSIRNSDGKKGQTQEICKISEFYKKPYISYKEFQKLANTGDVILFRSQHSAARLQQVFLNSQYDHVAVVLRNKKNELFLYESSSFDGVGFTEWKHMLKYEWYKSTEKIAWRRLNFQLQKHHYDTIENFIVKTLGKGFDITLDKVFSFQSKLQREKSEDDSKTYFCSQLVARMYKEIGLLDANVSCTQYYPVTFSDTGNLNFSDPRASLDKQYLIAF